MDEYIMGAMQIYIDVIRLFIEILKILNESKKKK
jgi:FtsH-binding integral membrane protein